MLLDHVRHARAETGGVVMGYWVGDREVVITAATSAGSRATHREDGYEPDVDHDQREIARIYQESGRLHTYLGDWHTHPLGAPVPSSTDRRTVEEIATDPDYRAPNPLYAIVATPWHGVASRRPKQLVLYSWGDERLVPMEVVVADLPVRTDG